jgi:hypothetical protein
MKNLERIFERVLSEVGSSNSSSIAKLRLAIKEYCVSQYNEKQWDDELCLPEIINIAKTVCYQLFAGSEDPNFREEDIPDDMIV